LKLKVGFDTPRMLKPDELLSKTTAPLAALSINQPTDFVFAGDSGNPRWQETILTDRIKPAAARAGTYL
jgi:hypothetical protein